MKELYIFKTHLNQKDFDPGSVERKQVKDNTIGLMYRAENSYFEYLADLLKVGLEQVKEVCRAENRYFNFGLPFLILHDKGFRLQIMATGSSTHGLKPDNPTELSDFITKFVEGKYTALNEGKIYETPITGIVEFIGKKQYDEAYEKLKEKYKVLILNLD